MGLGSGLLLRMQAEKAFKQLGVQADVSACVAHLREAGCEVVFTVGFCFGGRNSWLSAASGHGLAGAVGFYGGSREGRDGSPGPTARAAEMTCPILALQAGADQNITAEDNAAFDVEEIGAFLKRHAAIRVVEREQEVAR